MVNIIAMSRSPQRLVLEDCSILDDEVFEILFGSPVLNLLTVLDLGGTKLGCNAGHIRWTSHTGDFERVTSTKLRNSHDRFGSPASIFIFMEITHSSKPIP